MSDTSRRGFVVGVTGAGLMFGLERPVEFMPAAQAAEASGYFKYRVGEIEAFSLDDGTIERAVDASFIPNAPIEEVRAVLASPRFSRGCPRIGARLPSRCCAAARPRSWRRPPTTSSAANGNGCTPSALDMAVDHHAAPAMTDVPFRHQVLVEGAEVLACCPTHRPWCPRPKSVCRARPEWHWPPAASHRAAIQHQCSGAKCTAAPVAEAMRPTARRFSPALVPSPYRHNNNRRRTSSRLGLFATNQAPGAM